MYDLIIIGAGPAGMTSALYASRAGAKILVLEAKAYGGQIISSAKLENYPGLKDVSGFQFATNLYNQIKDLGVEVKFEKVISIDKDKNVTTSKNTYKTKSIIIASGATNRKLGIPGEEKFIGNGISNCATCDGNFYKDEIVAVVGGGNTAFEDSLYLSNVAKKIYLINISDTFNADRKTVEEVKSKKNVEFILNSEVVEIVGDDSLQKIIIKTGSSTRELEVNGLFVAIGQVPETSFLKNAVELDQGGYVKSEDGVHTSVDSVYVAGDVRMKDLRQLTTAVSDGTIAATVAMKEIGLI